MLFFYTSDIAIFETGARHVAMDLKDRNQANPTSILLSAAWLLKHLGLDAPGLLLEKSVFDLIREKNVCF